MRTTKRESLEWGIIGCGKVVENKSGPALLNAARSETVAVMRRDAAKAQAYAEQNGVSLATANPEEVINHPEIDVIYVATPPCSHKEYALKAARAQKNIVVEKPIGMNAAEAEEMIKAATENNVQLFVAYYRRFQPHIVKIRELIREGALGAPGMGLIEFAAPVDSASNEGWRTKPEISSGGFFVDLVSHRLDAMVFLLGPLQWYEGTATTFQEQCNVEQLVSLVGRFTSGAHLNATGDFWSVRKRDNFVIAGNKGAIYADPLDEHAFLLETADGKQSFRFDKFAAPHAGFIEHVENVLLDGVQNETSGEEALVTESLLDTVVREKIQSV